MKHLFLVFGLLFGFACHPAKAVTTTCGTGGSVSTCAAAIAAAAPGDTIQWMPGYTTCETFNINTPGLTLDGNGNWIDCSNLDGGSTAGWSGGNPFSGKSLTVPGYYHDYGQVVPGTICGQPGFPCAPAPPTVWAPSTSYSAIYALNNGSLVNTFAIAGLTSVTNNNRLYVIVSCSGACVSGSGSGPVSTTPLGSETDGTITWTYIPDFRSVVYKNFIFTGACINQGGFNSCGAIRGLAEGLLTIKNTIFLNNQVGLDYGPYSGSVITCTNCIWASNGLNYQDPSGNYHGDSGNSHNIYVTNVAKMTLTDSISVRATEAREVKFRGNHLVMNDTIIGGQWGGPMNVPDGGKVEVNGTGGSIWNIPPSASCSSCRQLFTYADESQSNSRPAPYSNSASNLVSNTLISVQSPVTSAAYVPLYFAIFTFDGTDTWYNSNVPNVPTDGPLIPRVVGVPTSTTGATMTRAQWNSALAIVTAGNSVPFQAIGYLVALSEYYDLQWPPGQATASLNGWSGPSPGDTITVATHPNITAVHGVPYVALATGNYPGTPNPLATFTNSNNSLQNVEYIGTRGVGGQVDINWGDSSPSLPDHILTATGNGSASGFCAPPNGGCTIGPNLTLYAAHTWASPGSYTVTITFHEVSPGTGTVTTTLTATVS